MSHKVFRLFLLAILMTALVAVEKPSVARAAGPWYVATTGNDANSCLSPAAPCSTLNGAIGKATSGDTINVALGIYTGTGNEVALLNKDAILVGGWNESFTANIGLSTIDGQGVRRGITVFNVNTVESFIIQNGTLFNSGGGIFNFGTLTLNNSIVSGNSTDFGGGISNSGTLTLNNSTVSDNTAATFGGGILNSGPLTLNNSTVSGNTSIEFGGGGIANSGGVLIMNNSTVSGNSTPDSGGGILNAGGPVGTVTLNYTTVSNNSADSLGGGIANFSSTGTITLKSSIVAGNKIAPSNFDYPSADCFTDPEVVTLGYNLVGNGTGCAIFGAPGDISVTPSFVFTIVLNALDDNGGLTQTHALIPGPSNAALNAIPSGTNNCGSAPFDADQRGVARPQGTHCDIGAFELEVVNPVMEVHIDIVPGSASNIITAKSISVQVAILSSDGFNAFTDVDRSSLRFGKTGNESTLQSCNKSGRDVNNDGRLDLVCTFHARLTGLVVGDTVAILRGSTVAGIPFESSDSVIIRSGSK